MPRSTKFIIGDIVTDWRGKHYYLLLEFIRTNEDYDLFYALCLDNGLQKIWGFTHTEFNKAA